MDKKEYGVRGEGQSVLDSEIGGRPASKAAPGKKKRKGFNILDLLIILMIAAAAVITLLAYRPGFLSGVGGGTKMTAEYDLVLSSCEKDYLAAVSVGDTVFAEKGGNMGSVISVKSEPSVHWSVVDGSAVASEDSDRVDLVITVRAEASDNGKAVIADGVRIAAGARYRVILPGLTGDAVAVEVRIPESSK